MAGCELLRLLFGRASKLSPGGSFAPWLPRLHCMSFPPPSTDLWGLAIFLAAIGASFTWGAVWLSFGRHEWKLEKGRLVLQRRFGANRTTRFEAVALELTEDSSGDDGITYQLAAVAPNASPRPHSHRAGRHRRIIHSQTDDATGPRRFGLWLSQRCQVPFADMTSTEAKAKQLEDLKQQLAASGRIGRLALRFIEASLVRARAGTNKILHRTS